ncbi:type I-E CRISPR-associated protein Cse1/CasA [Streptomyces uncialis]|uniref:type I-E CRISPR-associated protein Cse1/CasA n=1 Tax=Streptomyces uncialis TaxID=1048205 RepID=UPI0037B281B6
MFNLVDEPWLRASCAAEVDKSGSGAGIPYETGLRELLLHANKFRDLVVDLPTQKPAVLRQLLLPIVVSALGWPKDAGAWTGMFEAGEFTEEERGRLATYLDEHRHRFDLFDAVDPFAQVAGLRTAKDETKGSALLVATAATGNNVPLFSSRSEGDPLELTPAQAAHWLLHTHCWDTAAIKTGVVGDPKVKAGKTTGNPTGPLGQLGVIMPIGRTLYETLLLNIPHGRVALKEDLPQWLRRATEGETDEPPSCATPVWQQRAPRGLLDAWTWQSRRVRLIPEETSRGTRVTRVVVAAGDRLLVNPDLEPHTAWDSRPPAGRGSAKGAKGAKGAKDAEVSSLRPRRHRPGRAAWRGLEALLAVGRAGEEREATATRAGFRTSDLLNSLAEAGEEMDSAYPLQIELTGVMYGNQSAVIEDVFFDEIPLPVTALDQDGIVYGALLSAVGQAEQLATAVNHLSGDLRRAAGSDPIPWDKGQRPGDTLLHALDPVVRRLLAGLQAAGDDFDLARRGLEAWEHKAGRATWRVAEQVFATAAPGTFAGRKVVKDGKEQIYRLSTAEAAFRRRLSEILTLASGARGTG